MSNSETHFCSLCKMKMRYNDLMEGYTCQNSSCSAHKKISTDFVGKLPFPVGIKTLNKNIEVSEIKKLKSDKTKPQIDKTTKSDDKK